MRTRHRKNLQAVTPVQGTTAQTFHFWLTFNHEGSQGEQFYFLTSQHSKEEPRGLKATV